MVYNHPPVRETAGVLLDCPFRPRSYPSQHGGSSRVPRRRRPGVTRHSGIILASHASSPAILRVTPLARFGIVHVSPLIGKWFPIHPVIQGVNIPEVQDQDPRRIIHDLLLQEGFSPGANLLTAVEVLVSAVPFLTFSSLPTP